MRGVYLYLVSQSQSQLCVDLAGEQAAHDIEASTRADFDRISAFDKIGEIKIDPPL